MPLNDGTGPAGEGPRTGRGIGKKFSKNTVAKQGLVASLLLSLFGFVKSDLNSKNSVIKTFLNNKIDNKSINKGKDKISVSNDKIIDVEYDIISSNEDK